MHADTHTTHTPHTLQTLKHWSILGSPHAVSATQPHPSGHKSQWPFLEVVHITLPRYILTCTVPRPVHPIVCHISQSCYCLHDAAHLSTVATLCDNITLMFRFVSFRFVSEKRLDRFFHSVPFRFRPFGPLIGQESTCIKRRPTLLIVPFAAKTPESSYYTLPNRLNRFIHPPKRTNRLYILLIHESFSGLLCNTIVLFRTMEENAPYFQRSLKTKR